MVNFNNYLSAVQKRKCVMLDLSITHLSPATYATIIAGDLKDTLTSVETPYGCIVYTLPVDFMENASAIPEDLCRILDLADQCKAMLIHFDAEADIADDLPVFIWD